MHDTAFHIGTLAMNIYADLDTAAVLEIGSQSVNGSLRDNALPTTNYVGIDIEEGDGVDVVVEPGKPLPVDDDSFDLVMASSVFEHDSCFWMTFLEMCRATKAGGYIYINAPSNGVVHRYPQDNWRFYPDSGRALAKWAISQGQAVTLVESFVAERENDRWNDFVAVFRKGRITKALPKVFVHEHVPCSNVLTWKSKEILNQRDETEDMVLLAEAATQRDALAEQVAQLNGRLADAAEQGERHRVEVQSLTERLADSDQVRDKLRHRESELRQRQEEIEQARSDVRLLMEKLAESEQARDELRHRESELRQRQEEIEQTRSEVTKLRAELQDLRARLAASEHQLHLEEVRRHQAETITEEWKVLQGRAHAAKAELEARLNERFEEIATLTRELQQAQTAGAKERRKLASVESELASAVEQSRAEKEGLERRLKDRFQEIATLSNILAEREAEARRSREVAEWFNEAGFVLANDSRTAKGRLLGLLPAFFLHKRNRKILKRKGLFDGDAYLEAHPDVAAAGDDPLAHYLKHGIKENRYRG